MFINVNLVLSSENEVKGYTKVKIILYKRAE